MSYSYILLAGAQEEYESSIAWYNKRSWAAADQFIEVIDHTLPLICEHPYRWRNEYRKYYELGIKNILIVLYTR